MEMDATGEEEHAHTKVIKLPAIVLMVVPNWVQTKEKKLERVAVVQKASQ